MWLGIDPGRSKCGWALVDSGGQLCLSGIIPSELPVAWMDAVQLPPEEREQALRDWTCETVKPSDEEIVSVVIGSGTFGKVIRERLAAAFQWEILTMNEKFTTLRARRLFWKLHPPEGLWKIVPTSVRVPDRDIDDLAAWAIVLQMIEEGES